MARVVFKGDRRVVLRDSETGMDYPFLHEETAHRVVAEDADLSRYRGSPSHLNQYGAPPKLEALE